MAVSRSHIGLDAGASIVRESFAVVHAPGRRRGRFAKACVECVASEAEALSRTDPSRNRFPAVVLGPSRSSEGQALYYLVRWLAESDK
jgi:hypothetical protein